MIEQFFLLLALLLCLWLVFRQLAPRHARGCHAGACESQNKSAACDRRLVQLSRQK
jgi:hypothetical protein